jgi:hypothetical protein
MKERPILFSAPMVRAILDGRKTQTRRPIKLKLGESGEYLHGGDINLAHKHIVEFREQKGTWFGLHEYTTMAHAKCPYGQPGDQLWVKETFARHPQFADIAYRADGEEFEDSDGFLWEPKWMPSIYMPRAASRILLEVTNIRIERLQDIREKDAVAEVTYDDGKVCLCEVPLDFVRSCGNCGGRLIDAVCIFKELWESIYGTGSWDANRWVWVIEFRRL